MKKSSLEGQIQPEIDAAPEPAAAGALDSPGDSEFLRPPSDGSIPPVAARLVHQLLLARLEGLGAAQVAAFVSGWSSALELARRTDLMLPSASAEVTEAIARLIGAIEAATSAAVADPDD